MAPILDTATGITPQILDDPELKKLLQQLQALPDWENVEEDGTTQQLAKLVEILEPCKQTEWDFEEQVDLHEWIHPLNVVDSALTWILKKYGKNILLLPQYHLQQQQNSNSNNNNGDDDDDKKKEGFATTLEQVQQCPPEILQSCRTLLQFTAGLLRNGTAKQFYNSFPAISDLLAAADEDIADLAVTVLQALAIPVALHKQQAPEQHGHTTQLHSASTHTLVPHYRSDVHDRLMATSRAWGTRSMGLGLYATVTADDSIHGQGGLPSAMGEVNFCYYTENKDDDSEIMQEISLTLAEILVEGDIPLTSPESASSLSVDGADISDHAASKKRRKVSSEKTTQKRTAKSTAELFFLAVEKAGGLEKIPTERWFSLLAEIRLARSFHSQAARCAAVTRRLRALIAILHSHPSQEMMSGYFQAQPELCVEVVDLLRPVVSTANVSAASVAPGEGLKQDGIANLVGTANRNVPFEVRMLAVEALTALVTRRDGSTSALSGLGGSGRLMSSVLTELGVGKGQYLGLLPTLIRYSLASLSSVASSESTSGKLESRDNASEATSGPFELGLAFVEATMAPPLPRKVQVERALRFVDQVLTLTSAVIGTPSGTSALVDCGLIPALLTTVSADSESVSSALLQQHRASCTPSDLRRIRAWLRFIMAQAVQILEGSIVTHSNALTAFHDLQGVDILTMRLSNEMAATKEAMSASHSMEVDGGVAQDADGDIMMEDAAAPVSAACDTDTGIVSSQRVLLYSIVTCLTVVFHQESSPSTSMPTGGNQLKKRELTDVVLQILDNTVLYGGHLAALVATLLSDILNSDPHVVHYAHESGIAKAFLKMVVGRQAESSTATPAAAPIIPPVPELIMALPNVISALALTEDGATAVAECNPFPSLLRLFYHPDYAMPRSRCLLNEMTAIVGTGLDEIMRHVDKLKPLVLKAIAEAMSSVVAYAEDLAEREDAVFSLGQPSASKRTEIEDERSCLIQYILNFGQLLEQILQNEDHCDPFVDAGGLDALLCLFPAAMPSCIQFLPYASCCSSPALSTMHHSTTEEILSAASKCIEFRYSAQKLFAKLIEVANASLDSLDGNQRELSGSGSFSIDLLPIEPVYKVTGQESKAQLRSVSRYLRAVVNVQWVTSLLANAIKVACQRSSESGSAWGRSESEWKKELSSEPFEKLVGRLSAFHTDALSEVCRVRTEPGFEKRDLDRLRFQAKGLRYRLRIVCPEGAVVRDGIEIDSCAKVGSLEMGDIIDSDDRCINSCGILRYRTSRGWVSEMTRGHGQEPIAEIINLWQCDDEEENNASEDTSRTRVEAGVPDLRAVAVGILSRGQSNYAELFSSLSKLVIQGIRTLPIPASFDDGKVGSHVATIMRILIRDARLGLSEARVVETASAILVGEDISGPRISAGGAAMYLGCLLGRFHVCLFDDRRERRMVNFPFLVSLVASDPFFDVATSQSVPSKAQKESEALGFFDAIRVVLKYGLTDFSERASSPGDSVQGSTSEPEHQRVGRCVASSFPPLISLVRKLISTPMSSSPAASIMSRLNWKDLSCLLNKTALQLDFFGDTKDDAFFHPECFVADLQFSLSKVVKEIWSDGRLVHTPPFLVYPLACLVGEIIVVLEDISKKKTMWTQSRASDRLRLSELMRRRQGERAAEAADFEASEDVIVRLMEMGFSRDHALDALESTRSNRLETAMDYALTNGPPSQASIERRRAEREARARRREESARTASSNEVNESDAATIQQPPSQGQGDDASGANPPEAMDVEPPAQEQDKNANDQSVQSSTRNAVAKSQLALWLEVAPNASCSILNHMPRPSPARAKQASSILGPEITGGSYDGEGDAESEALTVVLCSFMLDICHRFPDQRSEIVSQVLASLKSRLSEDGKGGYCVEESCEAGVAALCHATVLIARALPKTRLLLLKEGLVSALISCIQSHLSTVSKRPQGGSSCPVPLWLAPSLLILEIMAQPIVAFSDEKLVKGIMDTSPDSDFIQVEQEHKEQVNELCQMASCWFNAALESSENSQEAASEDHMDLEKNNSKQKARAFSPSDFGKVPAYFPLLPSAAASSCLELCLTLLGRSNGKAKTTENTLPSGVAQSTLLLLLRLLRTPKVSSHCVQIGVAEAILVLPKACRFTGNTGLVTLVFRRLLEAEATLQSAMETEIRGTVSKLLAKKHGRDGKASVSLSSFIESSTSLLIREPTSFMKAMALSVTIKRDSKAGESRVALLSDEERTKLSGKLPNSMKALNNTGALKPDPKKDDLARPRKNAKGKVAHKGARRNSLSKKNKKGKIDSLKNLPSESSSANITGLLVGSIIAATAPDIADGSHTETFLGPESLLEILADLVLAIPACASAVHNYRPHRSKDKSRRISLGSQFHHALHACPSPPKSFVTFLLHSLLPQDRWSLRNDPQVWERRKESDETENAFLVKAKKLKAQQVMKLSQATARVLVALVARPGEGRKRVIADLVFAFSGGRLGHGSVTPKVQPKPENAIEPNSSELHALIAWGELCLGVAAPRSNSKAVAAGGASLSIDNLRLMLQHGMVHALLYAIHRVRLFHPMAPHTITALLWPLEILTRYNVNSAVERLVAKEKEPKESCNAEQVNQSANEVSQDGDAINGSLSIGYDSLVEDELRPMDDVDSQRDADEANEDDDGASEDEEMPSSDGSEDEETDEESDEDEMDEDGESPMEDSDDASGDPVDDDDDDDGDIQYDHIPIGADETELGEENGTERAEENVEEGWTRIESNGFGGMMLGNLGAPSQGVSTANLQPRSRGFIDAAEAMIGTLLRNGDISGEALAEIEGTLGIRIMRGGRALQASLTAGANERGDRTESQGLRASGGGGSHNSSSDDFIGTLPHVHQRNQPDSGYSAFGRGSHWSDISSMEYAYGGPTVTGGSRNYALVSTSLNNTDLEEELTLSQHDLHLFPGGLATAAGARTQHSLHPLLCGVELPPMNALVSDLLPHGVRATRRGQMATRRPGDWSQSSFSTGGHFVSTSNGNIVRSNRAQTGGGFFNSGQQSHNTVGPVSWTDDGLPVDATVGEFRSAFESALNSTVREPADTEAVAEADADASEGNNAEQADSAEVAEDGTERRRDQNSNANTSTEQSAERSAIYQQSTGEPSPAAENGHGDDSPGSDGDRVASSLVAGLRLSTAPETDPQSGRMQEDSSSASRLLPQEQAQEEEQAQEQEQAQEGAQEQAPEQVLNVGSQVAEDSNDTESPVEHICPPGDASPSATNPEGPGPGTGEMSGSAPPSQDATEPEQGVSSTNRTSEGNETEGADDSQALVCPPDVDEEVFRSLPRDMQQDCIDQYNATQELAAQLNGSSLDPEVLAALPEDMRREVIEQDRQERRMREQEEAPADPSRAEEMDNASFVASLAPELREEILLTSDEEFINSLPPGIRAEAQILRERASSQQRRAYGYDGALAAAVSRQGAVASAAQPSSNPVGTTGVGVGGARRRQRSGKLKVEKDRSEIIYLPDSMSSPVSKSDVKAMIRLMYLLSPVRPPRLLQKVFLNLCYNPCLRTVLTTAFVDLLCENGAGALKAVESLVQEYKENDTWRRSIDNIFWGEDEFPPPMLLGAAPEVPNSEAFNLNVSTSLLRRKHGHGTAASMAANLPKSSGGTSSAPSLPPIVAARLIETMQQICKSPRLCLHTLTCPISTSSNLYSKTTCFEKLIELLDKPIYANSAGNLEQLLTLLESVASPLSYIPKQQNDEIAISEKDVELASAGGREFVDVPRVVVSQSRLQLLCSILRMETCRDAAFTKVNTIIRRLCRVEDNRGCVLAELASVAHALGVDAIRDLRALRLRMDTAISQHQRQPATEAMQTDETSGKQTKDSKLGPVAIGSISSSVALSTSTSELKLLRVLQTLQALCNEGADEHNSKKNEGSVIVTEELVHLLRQMQFDDLWDELSSCLKVVQVLEGVKTFEDDENDGEDAEDDASGDEAKTKKLRNSAAGLLTRFLPSVEAFFVANGSATRSADKDAENADATKTDDLSLANLVGGQRMLEFVTANRVLLNALIRNNPTLMDKGLRALVQVPRFRGLLDFDVKRQWFKTQVRRLRQQASRRHGSLRLQIRRKNVFEDAYHQLQLRNADELRGRLHVTFRDEEGVDAGGLSREFFGILAKEMFNPNYALFTSTEDGCTFQPNPNSIINPDHLSYFRFVGRVVGKAVADGYLLDAHFTRSLYKHMLGLQPTHHDMEAIDPDYYRNLKTILEYKLSDIGLDLTFSIEDHSFGRSQVIDLKPNGRKVAVTEENKEEYVRLVCQHRMTTAIENQIKSYLAGFYELVSRDLIAIFTPRELELLISGLPDIDVHDLKKHTDYVVWKATDREIGWFWNILFSLSRNEKAAFLQFVTGSSKVPLSGFSELQGMRGIQKFSIHKAHSGTKGALMSAHTCFNSLDLPAYQSEEEMREKLLYAINEGGGAFLFA